MTKYFIINLLLNLAIIFLGFTAYQIFTKNVYDANDFLIAGLSIAFMVVMVYLKVVLTKKIKAVIKEKDAEKKQQMSSKDIKK